MRLWSLHPRYLDRQGLIALWREGLLAQAVLLEQTRGYRQHPQLLRFRQQADPVRAIGAYLQAVQAEAQVRGYAFNADKLADAGPCAAIAVSSGQLQFEWRHLLAKLQIRDPERARRWQAKPLALPDAHPLFVVAPGEVADWERGKAPS